MTIEDFFNKMSVFFPAINNKIEQHILEYGERLDTIVIEEDIMPEVVNLLKRDLEDKKIADIFSYFEEVSISSDKYLHDVFLITVLEIIGNDVQILEKAKKYMGPETTKLQKEADVALGR
ncbi:DUF7674 family protein [Pseudobutyrivibrio xylanivorans]|uniref:DUF7674 domain-containing protein n=1 Tax=Pseudobutyrivibrio xylanivorans TaxID=185007 RepID=A0A1G5S4X2_PSEXY|nr:hypothetical protein [Pseudobutyrivibrio xylanivorans]SCZ81452.1 hypothetical protein SAMN02910350_02828 [Pseudobutyrivibrio xylanivorans]